MENISAPVLSRTVWQARAKGHHARVAAMAQGFLDRRSRGTRHPVHDFLFTYYTFPPSKLMRWLPALGERLVVEAQDLEKYPWLAVPPMHPEAGLCSLLPAALPDKVRDLARWVHTLCQAVAQRPPRLRCYGLHEWAMVYRQPREQVRHQGYELRLSPEDLAAFVESQTVCCSHYDAFRFFTPEAKPLNLLQPVLETRLEMEQGGCLHTNMDLYKWSAKLWPWCGSDLVGECFALACEGRALDMRASPYDLRHLGYEPVKIETAEGRAQYEQEQRQLAEKAAIQRARLAQAAAVLAVPSADHGRDFPSTGSCA
ncbi:MAG: hypothetical protein LDL31_02065 [Prosthecobacter sp.]|nr:hypothetical protein [Prosthecobacter sp.]